MAWLEATLGSSFLHADLLLLLNAVEMAQQTAFHSIVNLQTAINRFIAETNDDPTPFVWTANPNKIVAAVKRGHQALDSIH